MHMIRSVPLALGLASFLLSGAVLADETKITVYKTPTCGCCSKWVSHLEQNGFEVESINRQNLRTIKSMAGVEPKLASCHTAKVDGYVIEGHVPADDIKRLLAERPDVKGLAAPGMPHGSPGMESGRKDAYQVLSFDESGKTQLFTQH